MKPAAYRKKAVFGTVRAGDHIPNRPAVPEIEERGILGSRHQISISSYSDDAILGKAGTWADTVTALA